MNNLPEKEFRIMIIKVLWRLENRMEKMQKAFNTVNTITKDIEEIKNKQTEMNNTITEIKNTLEGTNGRITGRGMGKWAGGQNGENNCWRTE